MHFAKSAEADRFGMTVDIERKRDPLGVKRLR